MRRISGKVIYGATAVGIFALIGGFAIASISLTSSTQNASGNYVSSSGGVTGVTYTSTVLGATTNPAPSASTGTGGAPQAVVAGANAFCASASCTAGDFAQVVTYTFTVSMTGSIMITIQVTASAGGGTSTLYLKQAGSAVAGTIVLTWDVGTATSTLTAVTLGVQQCSGATCP
ncbi:MAG: hypothetical protein L3K09_03745 [Thermoplasmata archaeon]|nr:hypothetical protein [Thermoplasmata archaeon]